MSLTLLDLPLEILSVINENPTNHQNALICRDFCYISKYEEEQALRDPNRYIESLHPFVKYLIPILQY